MGLINPLTVKNINFNIQSQIHSDADICIFSWLVGYRFQKAGGSMSKETIRKTVPDCEKSSHLKLYHRVWIF